VSGPGAICLATGQGLLLPIEVQPENRKSMPWEDFLRGARLRAGARITEMGA
jgi:methionyl-tRNA formyltransferase